MISVKSHTGFQPLKTCLVGACYPPDFFSFIKDSKIRNIFEKVAEQTEEDYLKLIKILQQHSVQVFRPKIHSDYGMYLYFDQALGQEVYKRPPMQPRDDMIVIGEKLFVAHLGYGEGYVDPWDHIVDQVDPRSVYDYRDQYQTWKKVAPPCITRVGRDLYFDFFSHDPEYNRSQYFDLLKTKIIPDHFSDYRIHFVDCGGHSDAVFAPVVPGLIVTYEDPKKYQESFPGWEVIQVSHDEFTGNDLALKALKQTNGKWWIKDHEFDQDLVSHVEKHFDSWTGYSIETVFDVNLLMIDQHNAIINSENKIIVDALTKRGINVHVCAFRQRFFWDCGLHCATLDLYREGDLIDYFV